MEVDLSFVKNVIADLTLENKLLQAQNFELQRQLELARTPPEDTREVAKNTPK